MSRFYTRHPLDTLLLSDPFFNSFLQPLRDATFPRLGLGLDATPSTAATRAFSPNFDVHETPKEYILEGELPGLEDRDKNLTIEFTDSNTMVIRGKIERSFTAGTPPAGYLEGTRMKGAITEVGETPEAEGERREGEGEKREAEGEKGGRRREEEETVKYWVSERTVGSFQRSFSFPGEVDQDNVKANYQNGILRVVIPKREKRGAKRITIG